MNLQKYHLRSSTYSLGDKKWRLREVGCSGEFNKTRDFRGFPSWWPPIQRVCKHPALQTSSKKPEMKKNPKMQTRGKQREELKEAKRNYLRQLF